MISFKEYLTESRSAPLYHTTSFRNLNKILASGLNGETFQTIFKGMKTASWGRYGISTSRSLKKSIDYFLNNMTNAHKYVVFVLDQQKIAQNYKIVPVDYFTTRDLTQGNPLDTRRIEDEEFIVLNYSTDGHHGFLPSSYIKQVLYLKTPSVLVKEEYQREIEQAKKKFPRISFVEIDR